MAENAMLMFKGRIRKQRVPEGEGSLIAQEKKTTIGKVLVKVEVEASEGIAVLEGTMAGTPVAPAPQPPAANAGGITPTPAARAFLSHVTEAGRFALAQKRPWSEMFDRNAFAKPESFSEAVTRIRKNLGYFRINYLICLLAVVTVFLITHLGSLLCLLVIVAAWGYLYMVRREPLVLWGRSFSEREILVLMTVITVVGFFLTDVGSLLISSLLVGIAIISAHGAFRVPDDLFLDDQEAPGGLFSFLGPATSQPPVIVSHV
ncbi:hypothetical protein R1sor_018036 [Riccia sorocarpa]|uniref:PRA1 family protein n=1 Tax=Riccia sorocarpa TaxID=122646 RepID=A0ABD3IAB9_9MARC